MSEKFLVVRHPIGFYEVSPKPSISELSEHYSKKFYKQKVDANTHSHTYSDEEINYFNVCAKIAIKTFQRFSNPKKPNLLDLGCGEGFFANYFSKNGWKTSLVDFSDAGLRRHNPSLLESFQQADLFDYLDSKKKQIKTYDLVNLDSVLEHVIDPIKLLNTLKTNMSSDAILKIEVPNDFSSFQNLLINLNCTEETWVSPPEHLSYFNCNSLRTLLDNQGFDLLSLQADFPIEQFLLNEHSNYWKDRKLGKGAHQTRVRVTNYLAQKNLDRMIDYQEAAADLEFGRSLTAYVRVSN